MHYLSDERMEKRKSLSLVYEDVQSSLVFLFSYADIKRKHPSNQVAGFALGFNGKDYHHTLNHDLNEIGHKIQTTIKTNFIVAVDTLPILERDLAYRAGLGFIGKNSMLISPKFGSYVMIGSILFDEKLPLPVREKIPDHCGNCNRCLDACPTKALIGKRELNASECLAYYTVEVFNNKTPPPKKISPERPEIFGCDICQDVCPWNNKILREEGPSSVKLDSSLIEFFKQDKKAIFNFISSLSNKQYQNFFIGTSFYRLSKRGFLKNFLGME